MIRFLTREQVSVLTGKKPNQYAAQRRALRKMGIDFRERPDGRPIVLESDIMINEPKTTKTEKVELNLSAI